MRQTVRVEKVRDHEKQAFREQMLNSILQTGVDFPERTIYLVDEITLNMAVRFRIALDKLDESPGPVRVVLMSAGGYEPAGWSIYDAIRSSRNDVVVDAAGVVASMATAILQAGDVRRMERECRLMVHPGTIEMDGSIDQRAAMAMSEELKRTHLRYQQVLAERTGMAFSQMAALCDKESFFSAKEALDAGFIDVVLPYTAQIEPAAAQTKTNKKRKRK